MTMTYRTSNHFRSTRPYWTRTWTRLQEAFATLTPPVTATCVPHPDRAMAGEGWDLLTIDGVSLPAQLGDGAVYLWESDPETYRRTHDAQVFPLRRGHASAIQVAKTLRHAVVNHKAIVEEHRKWRAEQWKQQEAARQEREAKWKEAVNRAQERRVAFEAAIEERTLSGADVHLYVGEPSRDCGGGVYSRGGDATLTVRFRPWEPEEAKKIIDALVSAGLLRRRTP